MTVWAEVPVRLNLESVLELGEEQEEREILLEGEGASQQGERALVPEAVVASQRGAQGGQMEGGVEPLQAEVEEAFQQAEEACLQEVEEASYHLEVEVEA